MKKTLLFVLNLLLPMLTWADGIEINGIHYILDSANKLAEVTVTGDAPSYDKGYLDFSTPNEYYGNIIIPETIEYENVTYTVNSIGLGAFNNSQVTSVTMPNSVKSIGDYAFTNCTEMTTVKISESINYISIYAFHNTGLTSVTIPNSVQIIGTDAFARNSKLASVKISESTTFISNYAFTECKSLTSIDIPNSVETIGSYAFYECALTKVTLGSSIKTIGEYAFFDNKNISGKIVFPCTLETLGDCNFWGCALESVEFKDSPCNIGDNVFYQCSNLTSVTFGNKIRSIGNTAFGASGIISAILPCTVEKIGEYAFCSGSIKTFIIESSSATPSERPSLKIGNRLCYGCPNLTTVTLGNTVVSIDECAFEGTGIEELILPNSLDSIGTDAFGDCTSLKSLKIENAKVTIGEAAFNNCTSLSSVDLGNAVTTLGKECFNYCPSILSLTIPCSVKEIGSNAFCGCSGLTSITIENGVEKIGNKAFFECKGITSLDIPSSVKSIESEAFYSCDNLTSINLPNSIDSICSEVFGSCYSLSSISIPTSVTRIGNRAFCYCKKLTSIDIPNSVTSIGERVFQGCTKLQTINIGNSVSTIGEGLCLECTSLTNIKVDSENKSFCAIDNVLFNKDCSNLIVSTNRINYTIPSSVKTIDSYAFRSCTNLSDVSIPNSVVSIGYQSFAFTKLTSLEIPNSVKTLGGCSFSNCSNLITLNLGNSIEKIEEHAFNFCVNLKSVEIPNSVTYIGDGAFSGCTSLTSISIPSSVVTIGSEVLGYCRNLKTINIADDNQYYCSIDNVIFNAEKTELILFPYSKEGEYEIPNTVITIADKAFKNCENLTNITIPFSVKTIETQAFCYCTNLTNLNIPNSITTIKEEAFYGCSNLKNIAISSSLDSLHSGIFEFCTNLQSINIPNSVTSIDQHAFYECANLTTAIIPKSVENLEFNAFGNCGKLKTVYCFATDIPQNSIQAFDNSNIENCTLYVPSTSVNLYKDVHNWSEFGSILPIESATEIINLNPNKLYTTYCNPTFTLDFTDNTDVVAYKARYDGIYNCIIFTRVNQVPAGTGVILLNRSKVSTTSANIVGNTAELTENSLIGTTIATTLTYQDFSNQRFNYVLSSGVFYPIADNTTIDAGKAYLSIAYNAKTQNTKALFIKFEDEDTPTNVTAFTADHNKKNNALYTIEGVRITKPSKGIYIINGKKIVY